YTALNRCRTPVVTSGWGVVFWMRAVMALRRPAATGGNAGPGVTLTPAERVSFVLHDVFEIPFDAIAAILGRSTAATKMLASRARGRLRLGTPATAADAAAREVVDAFFAAAGRGDLAGLLAV